MEEQTFQMVRAAVFATALGAGLLLERIARHTTVRPAWRTNLGLWATNGAVVGVACGACACTAAQWAGVHRVGLLNLLEISVALAILATVVTLDLVSYAWHRANHRVGLLWRFHRVHHADADFHVSTALRFHPGEILLSLPLRLLAIIVLGAPVLGVLVFEIVFTCANILEHGNFDLPRRLERRLSTLFVTPALHRWHHSRKRAELDSNFGTILTVWDRSLGTFQKSDSSRVVATGLPSGRPNGRSFRAALTFPFRPDEEPRGAP